MKAMTVYVGDFEDGMPLADEVGGCIMVVSEDGDDWGTLYWLGGVWREDWDHEAPECDLEDLRDLGLLWYAVPSGCDVARAVDR